MSKTRVEFQIKGLDRFTIVAVSDFPYRLNRIAFVTTADKMKALGGTLSTKIKLTKDNANNNRIFVGKTDFKSYGKFNESVDYPAVIKENGGVIARGVFRLDKVTAKSYEGTFFDFDSAWIEQLSKVKLNRIGYFEGSPTWTADFDGAATFNEVNDKTNRETDLIFPTALYNNTPVLDFLEKTNHQIWGTYEGVPLQQEQPPESFPNDFNVLKGFHATLRQGLKFEHFPPALYYRNVIEKVAAEIGYSVDCPLFYTDWFNALVMAYTGDGYIYNWKRIGTVSSHNPNVQQSGEGNFDKIEQTSPASPSEPLSLNKLMLPQTDQAPTHVWILEEQFSFSLANVIKHDDINTLIDPVTLTNSFEREGAYLVPRDGDFKINVTSQYKKGLSDTSYYEPNSFYWEGGFLFNAFGGWDANSDRTVTPDVRNRWYGWDDNVLIVAKADRSGKVSDAALDKVYKWMNGKDKSLTTSESDIIAYFSPKRFELADGGASIPDVEIMGSPFNNFDRELIIEPVAGAAGDFVGHNVIFASDPRDSASFASISIECTLSEGDHIKIFWVSLVNIYGNVARDVDPDTYDFAFNGANTSQEIGLLAGNSGVDPQWSKYSIEYLCGDDKLDLAANLPDMSAKDFLADFIKTFNLHPIVQDKTISFYPIKEYYSPVPYDITSRVDTSKNWESEPIKTPSKWSVGYSNDPDDYLLKKSTKRTCGAGVVAESSNYANVEIGNENVYSKDVKSDLNMFSATKFISSQIALNPFGWGLDSFPYTLHTSVNPAFPSSVLTTGLTLDVIAANAEAEYLFPSIMSKEQSEVEKYSDWFLEFNKTPRLFYHLGTVNQYTTHLTSNNYGHLIDMPRGEIAFMNLSKHWFRPTVSQFDGENAAFTGINYPTLRFDGANGLFNRYFENLLDFFNLSEQLTLRAALTPKDWNELKGHRKVRFLGQLYRLMLIKDYDPETRKKCIIKLLKEV